ncbi:hypothetical protein PMIN06_002821 [Paraphaeosphaeria minitans]
MLPDLVNYATIPPHPGLVIIFRLLISGFHRHLYPCTFRRSMSGRHTRKVVVPPCRLVISYLLLNIVLLLFCFLHDAGTFLSAKHTHPLFVSAQTSSGTACTAWAGVFLCFHNAGGMIFGTHTWVQGHHRAAHLRIDLWISVFRTTYPGDRPSGVDNSTAQECCVLRCFVSVNRKSSMYNDIGTRPNWRAVPWHTSRRSGSEVCPRGLHALEINRIETMERGHWIWASHHSGLHRNHLTRIACHLSQCPPSSGIDVSRPEAYFVHGFVDGVRPP